MKLLLRLWRWLELDRDLTEYGDRAEIVTDARGRIVAVLERK